MWIRESLPNPGRLFFIGRPLRAHVFSYQQSGRDLVVPPERFIKSSIVSMSLRGSRV
jgi:hypothetical protein